MTQTIEMDGPGHYRESERLLHGGAEPCALTIAKAQVHAALALAAATAYPAVRDYWDYWGESATESREWARTVSRPEVRDGRQ